MTMGTLRFGPFARRRPLAITLVGALLALAVALIASGELNARTAFGAGGGGGCFASAGPVCTVKGHQAFADFTSQSSDGCTLTDVQVAAFDSVVRPAQQSGGQFVLVMLNEENFCQGTYIFADNVDPNLQAPVFTGTFQFNSGPDLNTASLTGTAPMFDPIDNIQFVSTINVAWSGFGPTTTFLDSFHLRSPGLMLNEHMQGASRQAEASGTVSGPANENLASTPTLNGDLSSNSGGTVSLSRP